MWNSLNPSNKPVLCCEYNQQGQAGLGEAKFLILDTYRAAPFKYTHLAFLLPYRSVVNTYPRLQDPHCVRFVRSIPGSYSRALLLPRAFTGRDPSRGSGQEVFKISRGESSRVKVFEFSRVRSGRVGSGRVGSGRVGSGRVGSGRVGSGWVGSGRVRSGRVGWGNEAFKSHGSG